jgi:hypothetical protein
VVGLYLGWIGAFGISIVANFQVPVSWDSDWVEKVFVILVKWIKYSNSKYKYNSGILQMYQILGF